MRMKHKREYYIPKGSRKINDWLSDAVVYLNEGNDRFDAMGFSGKAQKPAFYFTYRKPENRQIKVTEFFKSRRLSLAYKAEQKAARKAAGRGVKIGDLLRRSWGYDQTNIDYWQVTALVGKTMVEIRPLAQEITEWTGYDRGKCVPIPDKFTGPAERRVAKAGQVKINHYAWAFKIETEVQGVKTYAASSFSTYH